MRGTRPTADMRRVMAVEILNPEMAAGLPEKFEFIPQQARIAAKAVKGGLRGH